MVTKRIKNKSILIILLLCSISKASEWVVESLEIKKIEQSEEIAKFLGDWLVTVKLRNVSKVTIKVQKYLHPSFIAKGQLCDKEFKEYLVDRNKIHHICCHPPTFDVVKPNEVFTVSYRELSKYKGKTMELRVGGKEVIPYVLQLTKMDNKPK